jgi:hypothetical protein
VSANRIVKRRDWRSRTPVDAKGAPLSYHDDAIAAGHRHLSFQRAIRAARRALGLSPTSGNMHRAYGQKI